jgi:hypothetical protein
VYFGEETADITKTLSALYFYITVTNSDEWWIDELQLNKDVIVPGNFVRTTGASVARAADTRSSETRKVCSLCYREQWSDLRGRIPPERMDRWPIERSVP